MGYALQRERGEESDIEAGYGDIAFLNKVVDTVGKLLERLGIGSNSPGLKFGVLAIMIPLIPLSMAGLVLNAFNLMALVRQSFEKKKGVKKVDYTAVEKEEDDEDDEDD